MRGVAVSVRSGDRRQRRRLPLLALGPLLLGLAVPLAAGPAAAAEAPPSLVEDHAYPGAAAILADHGIRVITGDGRIRYDPDCAGDGNLIEVEAIGDYQAICFRSSGTQGFITMDLPRTYLVSSDDQPLTARSTYQGETEVVAVEPGLPAPIGLGNTTHTLVELRLTGAASTVAGPAGPHPSTARIETAGRACSGVLVAPSWLLTTRTCLAGGAELGAGPPPKPATAVVGRADAGTGGGHSAAIVSVIPRPDRDLALARLAAPANGIAPAQLAASAASSGQAVTVAGFARTGTDWVGRVLRTRAGTVSAVGDTTVGLTPTGSGPFACRGDAGGPVLRAAGDGYQVVGLQTAGWQGGCIGTPASETRQTSEAVRVDGLQSWVGEYTGSCGPAVESGFTPLWNGSSERDPGWRTAGPGTVTEDGCELTLNGAGVRWYAAQHLPAAYTLRLDWLSTGADADSGVLLGFPHPGEDPAVATARGVEAQIRPAGTGTTATGALTGLQAPVQDAQRPVWSWNTYELTVNGRRITVRLNGTQVNDLTVADTGRLLDSAFIGLQGSADGARVKFRNLRLRVDQPPARFGAVVGEASGRCIDISGYDQSDGARAHLYGCHGGLNQLFTTAPDGTLRVMGKCLDSGGPLTGSGDYRWVHLWSCAAGNANQRWTVQNGALVNAANNRCLDAWGAGTADGTALSTFLCSSDPNQRWALPVGEAGFGAVVGTGGKCVDIVLGPGTDGSRAELFGCNGGLNQTFTLPGDGTLRVQGKCLDALGPVTGEYRNVHLWECNGEPQQSWNVLQDGRIVAVATGLCLDVEGGGTADGAWLMTFPCHQGSNQRWSVAHRALPSAPVFGTGFESGQPAVPDGPVVDSGSYPHGGLLNVGGLCCGLTGPELFRGTDTPRGGEGVLLYSGQDTSADRSFAYLKAFDPESLTVGAGTVLSYWIRPQSTGVNGSVSGSNSTCVGLDVQFSDGVALRDLALRDQRGFLAAPNGHCGRLTLDAWNLVRLPIGTVAAGRQITRITVGYDQGPGTGGYRGLLDDLRITS